jgi:hypothetical protein
MALVRDVIDRVRRHVTTAAEASAEGCLGPTHLMLSNNDATVLCDRIEDLADALDDMVRQFAYTGGGTRTTGGLSALEHAFDVLGLDDPHPLAPEEMCDEPGCKEEITCGTPTPTGYRRTCGKHLPKREF